MDVNKMYDLDNPFDWMREMQKGFKKSFRNFPQIVSPLTDITEQDGKIIIVVDLPGMQKQDVEVYATEASIEIAAERKETKEQKGKSVYRRERVFGSYHRAYSLPAKINPNKINTAYKDGVLTITAPKVEKKSKRIKIKVD